MKTKTKDPIQQMIEAKAVMAPMSGVSDVPFRIMVRRYGCRFAFTEMIDVNAIVYKNKKSFYMLEAPPEDSPLGIQIVGQDPDKILLVAKLCEEKGFKILDLNVGCPARKVVKGGKGSAMLKDPKSLARTVGKLVKALDIPVTVKMRSGWSDESLNYVEVAKAVAAEGAQAICIHPRTKDQMYKGKPDHNAIREVKEAVDIPVFASGNLFNAQDVNNVILTTGCDGVFIARGALGKPWIFRDIERYFKGEQAQDMSGLGDIKDIILEHFELNIEYYGEKMGMRRMYKHICWYLKKFKNLDAIMKAFRKLEGYDEFKGFLNTLDVDDRNRLGVG